MLVMNFEFYLPEFRALTYAIKSKDICSYFSSGRVAERATLSVVWARVCCTCWDQNLVQGSSGYLKPGPEDPREASFFGLILIYEFGTSEVWK